MEKNRNDFIETLRFDISSTFEIYSKYLYDFKSSFMAQALSVHTSIMEDFPELDFNTICRIKSLESTMDKVKRKGLDKIYDIHGLKHILYAVGNDTSEDLLTKYCYKLQEYLEDYYSKKGAVIINCRTKDYIANPKENGYEAIHISGKKNDRRFETQIKTAHMEEISKYGNANHSEKYKPRTMGTHPLLKVPKYFIITVQKSAPVINELSLEDCFQYFYNVPYEKYAEKLAERD